MSVLMKVLPPRPTSYLGLLVRGHPEEGHEDVPVNVALHVRHGRGRGRRRGVEAAGRVTQVRVQALLQRLVEHHLHNHQRERAGLGTALHPTSFQVNLVLRQLT